ncbi:MAG: bifunctional aconitate hydratase 2/2-methylisocitrate dehydratase, partial [Planctomycetota bacterium]|nr:bifunctional aconitate hydratase 2/2-methylisocitrate dehydratase [Planctomycetota bacterium]
MDESYPSQNEERRKLGIPPLPLNAAETEALCRSLVNPAAAEGETPEEMLRLLAERVPAGVAAAAKVKADFLAAIAQGAQRSPALTPEQAVHLLGAMPGGWNVPHLIRLLDDIRLAPLAAEALKRITFVFDRFADVAALMRRGNRFARSVIESWASAEWLQSLPPLPEEMRLTIFRVEGEVNTDDLSPARHAGTRADIPLHSLSMGESRFPGGIATIAAFRQAGKKVAFAADILGTGSSRKSAANSLIWHIGEDIPGVPNKRRGGVVLAAQIAPIFFNTLQDAGCLAVKCDVSKLRTGQEIVLSIGRGRIYDERGKCLAKFKIDPPSLLEEARAGGRLHLLIGQKLAAQAQEALGQKIASAPAKRRRRRRLAYTLAQKIVGRACGQEGVRPGETCQPRITTVGSQDTTGPMTREELIELSCLGFQAELVMQSFCHTAAYPTERDRAMQESLSAFMRERGGVALKPGDGIIHSWLNRMLLPDTVGTGADSHTRFPLGISFPAGSGLVAFAAALGAMPLDMPESVLVRFKGKMQPGITLRDLVNAIPYAAIQAGTLTVAKEGKKNVFNGRILEIEGLPDLKVEQAFELSDASAERSAAGCTVRLNKEPIIEYLQSNITLLKWMIANGYQDARTLE